MTQKEKELLIKDLCARLPYGIFVDENIERLDKNPVIYTYNYHPCIDNCKPYLRPMESMTEEERIEYRQKQTNYEFGYFDNYVSIDWCNKKSLRLPRTYPYGIGTTCKRRNVYY